jgi:hypothetical protein
MSGQRDLPMGGHDMAVMSGPVVRDAFARYVSSKRDLVAHLQETLKQDEAMLAQMREMG